MKKITYWLPWIIVVMAFFATALSFLDRQVLSVSIIRIKEDFHISDVEYGFINTGFLISYAIMFTVGGVLIDRYGSRKGLGISVGIWSLATMLHGWANSAFHFGVFRFILGLGEGGAFPGAIKAVVEWIPKDKQALANGIAIGGSAVGAVVAPPLCVYLIDVIGWRGVFITTSVIGFIWVAVWFLLPKKEKRAEVPAPSEETKTEFWKNFSQILKIKEVWVFILIRFLLDPIFYFYMFWIPKYLNEARGISLYEIGNLFWIPFLALGISNMLGGYIADFVLRKTGSLNKSRKSIMGVAALLTLPAMFVQLLPSATWVIATMALVFFAHGLWITNYITAISDLFGKNFTSTVIGFSGSAGAISSLVINPLIGLVIASFSYDPMWIYAGCMYPAAFIIFLVFVPKIKRLQQF
ncbi:MFS transporter [Mangrovibacterium diazotrophicum]|uniref:ACS family hexuronate transporter-like MFS transporter n=1 Tax=Mangrovibacterium diazotrophicum TaxID=1261403 RepID=A0A419VYH9_9BACT|nr:MFS transporter [Mangrovibacterium diazotrophicum]RKD88297.1 ACS family hexuronate transporter-like MFS transporter [Mangrovibacterium diazotrophicum]